MTADAQAANAERQWAANRDAPVVLMPKEPVALDLFARAGPGRGREQPSAASDSSQREGTKAGQRTAR
jgi:hypothetical protein